MEFVNRIRIEALRSQESFQLGKFERTLLIPGTQSKFDIHYPRIVCSFDSLWAKPFSSPSVSKLCELWILEKFSLLRHLFDYSDILSWDQSGLFFIAIIPPWRHAACFPRMCSSSPTGQIVWEKNWFIGVDNFLIEIVEVNLLNFFMHCCSYN